MVPFVSGQAVVVAATLRGVNPIVAKNLEEMQGRVIVKMSVVLQ